MSTNPQTSLEITHQISQPTSSTRVTSDLYVCLDECYIYQSPGHEDADISYSKYRTVPDISYRAVPDEILQITTDRSGSYVRCLLPVEGWIYLPDPNVQHDASTLDHIYKFKKRLLAATEGQISNFEDYDHKYDDIDFEMQTESQRMMRLNKPKLLDVPSETITCCRGPIFYFRRHPFLPGLIVLVIQSLLACLVPLDIYTDIVVSLELYMHADMSLWFAVSGVFVCAPYFISWSVGLRMIERKLQQYPQNTCYKIVALLYNIAPIGVCMLILVDIYHLIECVFITPLYYLVTGGKMHRIVSLEEEGYYKLRSISEIFGESMPQAMLQAFLLIQKDRLCSSCTGWSIIKSLIVSVFSLMMWCTRLKLEASKNGMRFYEYVIIAYRGFNFVPFSAAIERGTKQGEKVSWTHYKLSKENMGYVALLTHSPRCRLSALKISKYTLRDLDVSSCRFFGRILRKQNVELIIARLEKDVMDLFAKYDTNHSESLDFDEFAHFCLVMKKTLREPCLRSDILLIYETLVDPVAHEIWLLDVLQKVRDTTESLGLLTYDLPLQRFYECSDQRMMSFLMAYEYEKRCMSNKTEFEHCVVDAVTCARDKIKDALCLCEDKGVPMVVRMESEEYDTSNLSVDVQIFEQAQRTKYGRNEALLFMIPFDKVNNRVWNIQFNVVDLGCRSLRSRGRGEDYFVGEVQHSVVWNEVVDPRTYHENKQVARLQYVKDFVDVETTLSYRVFLNAAYVYKQSIQNI